MASPTTLSLTPEILHESEGLRIRRNRKNGFVVVTLFYFADPAKRSPEWREEAKSGLSGAEWAKEYEIEYTALFGEKVFPEIATHRNEIVVGSPLPDVPDSAVCWGGLDYGARNPSSFHVYTILDGVTYAVWELYEPCKNIVEFCATLRSCPYYDRLRYIAADPTMLRNKTQQTKLGVVTVGSLFEAEGIYKLIPGNIDETAWLGIMRDHWRNPGDPTFRIYDCCPNMIREFEGAVFGSISERQQATVNKYSEEIVSKNNHALDDCKYFMNSNPMPTNTKLLLPKMYERWMN
jgi:hypothetical protein